MTMNNVAKKEICRILGIEFEERMEFEGYRCVCGCDEMMMWASYDYAVCVDCEEKYPVKEVSEYFRAEYSDRNEFKRMMEEKPGF